MVQTVPNSSPEEKLAPHNEEVAKWLRGLEWPAQIWTRENLSYLSESNYEQVYDWLREESRLRLAPALC